MSGDVSHVLHEIEPAQIPGPHVCMLKRRFFVTLLLRTTIGLTLLLGRSASTFAQEPRLVLNEAMANEPGGVTTLEWVEILNWPDSGDGSINLSGYRFRDGVNSTTFDTDLVVAPGGFVVLAEKPVGPSSFEEHWGDNSGVWGDAAIENYPVVEAKMALINALDAVFLTSPSGDSSVFAWEQDAGDGRSIERVHPNRGVGSDNALPSNDPSGSTPGRPNSVLARRDSLAIIRVDGDGEPVWGNDLNFTVLIANTGLGPSTAATLTLLEDIATSTPQFEAAELASKAIAPLDEDGSLSAVIEWSNATPGRHRLALAVHHGPDTTDWEDLAFWTVRHSQPLIVISEFLANPTPDGPGEWVEIANLADFPINMSLTKIVDSETSRTLQGQIGRIEPGDFWILAQDENAFRSFYNMSGGIVVEVPGWPTLNNDGDIIRLEGAAREIIDSMSYGLVYDGNRSVERVSLSPSFAKPGDWAASVDPSGATPGRANSVNRELAGSLQVSVSPNPIYLSRAGVTEIEYRMELGARLTLKVFDRSGRCVRTIADEVFAATGMMTWDGTDDDGAAVRPGAYVLLARSDPSGDVAKKVIVVGP